MTEIDAETRYLLRFKTGTYDEYESIALKDPFTLYFTYDTQQLFRGDKEYTKSVELVDELPETGISGKLYIVSGDDKFSLYVWDKNNSNYKKISDLYKERNVVFVTEVPEFENSRQETLYVYTDNDNNTHIYYKGEDSMIDALKKDDWVTKEVTVDQISQEYDYDETKPESVINVGTYLNLEHNREYELSWTLDDSSTGSVNAVAKNYVELMLEVTPPEEMPSPEEIEEIRNIYGNLNLISDGDLIEALLNDDYSNLKYIIADGAGLQGGEPVLNEKQSVCFSFYEPDYEGYEGDLPKTSSVTLRGESKPHVKWTFKDEQYVDLFQGDWQQNDVKQPSFIKNKPFGKTWVETGYLNIADLPWETAYYGETESSKSEYSLYRGSVNLKVGQSYEGNLDVYLPITNSNGNVIGTISIRGTITALCLDAVQEIKDGSQYPWLEHFDVDQIKQLNNGETIPVLLLNGGHINTNGEASVIGPLPPEKYTSLLLENCKYVDNKSETIEYVQGVTMNPLKIHGGSNSGGHIDISITGQGLTGTTEIEVTKKLPNEYLNIEQDYDPRSENPISGKGISVLENKLSKRVDRNTNNIFEILSNGLAQAGSIPDEDATQITDMNGDLFLLLEGNNSLTDELKRYKIKLSDTIWFSNSGYYISPKYSLIGTFTDKGKFEQIPQSPKSADDYNKLAAFCELHSRNKENTSNTPFYFGVSRYRTTTSKKYDKTGVSLGSGTEFIYITALAQSSDPAYDNYIDRLTVTIDIANKVYMTEYELHEELLEKYNGLSMENRCQGMMYVDVLRASYTTSGSNVFGSFKTTYRNPDNNYYDLYYMNSKNGKIGFVDRTGEIHTVGDDSWSNLTTFSYVGKQYIRALDSNGNDIWKYRSHTSNTWTDGTSLPDERNKIHYPYFYFYGDSSGEIKAGCSCITKDGYLLKRHSDGSLVEKLKISGLTGLYSDSALTLFYAERKGSQTTPHIVINVSGTVSIIIQETADTFFVKQLASQIGSPQWLRKVGPNIVTGFTSNSGDYSSKNLIEVVTFRRLFKPDKLLASDEFDVKSSSAVSAKAVQPELDKLSTKMDEQSTALTGLLDRHVDTAQRQMSDIQANSDRKLDEQIRDVRQELDRQVGNAKQELKTNLADLSNSVDERIGRIEAGDNSVLEDKLGSRIDGLAKVIQNQTIYVAEI